jgi:hypothetical protein
MRAQHAVGLIGLLLLGILGVDAQIDWDELVDDIARSSLLNTVPGSTLERE